MQPDRTVETDVLVVGSGGAALRAALAAHDAGASVTIVSKGALNSGGATVSPDSPSVAWQMADGCSSPEDSPEIHAANIVDTGLGMADTRLARILAEEVPARSQELERWGLQFISDPIGRQRHYTGYSCFADRPRAHGIRNSGWGHAGDVVHVLARRLRAAHVEVQDGQFVIDLLVSNTECRGALALDPDGRPVVYRAGAVVLGTGGAWQLFPPEPGRTIIDTTGDGYAVGFRAGAELTNMEFMQYMLHRSRPHKVEVPGVFWALCPVLRNAHGQEVLSKYLPAEVSSEEVMRARTLHYPFSSRDESKWIDIAIASERKAGRANPDGTLFIDYSSVDPSSFKPSRSQHVPEDFTIRLVIPPIQERMCISAHAVNGGLLIDEKAQTTIGGLFVAGETAAGPHGADRLGGAMVSGGQVFGERAGRYAAQHARSVDRAILESDSIDRIMARLDGYGRGDLSARDVKKDLQGLMERRMTVVRNERDLLSLISSIEQIKGERLPRIGVADCHDLREALEAENLLVTAELMVRAALTRRESRGSHYREDYPERDDERWGTNVILRLEEGTIHLTKRAFEPGGDNLYRH